MKDESITPFYSDNYNFLLTLKTSSIMSPFLVSVSQPGQVLYKFPTHLRPNRPHIILIIPSTLDEHLPYITVPPNRYLVSNKLKDYRPIFDETTITKIHITVIKSSLQIKPYPWTDS